MESKLDKVLVFRFGLMEANMRDIGEKENVMEEVNFIMLMEMFMMVTGRMIRLMAMEFM